MNVHTDRPTSGSTWLALAGSPITDEFLEWPADLFALTDVILERSEVFRFVLSPPSGVEWPPCRFPNWSDAVEEASRQWSIWVEDRNRPVPDLLVEEWNVFRERAEIPLEHLAQGKDWRVCEALLTLHAIADEPGSMARIHSHFVRVLPKARTPPNGTSSRAFSRYACVCAPGVEVGWYKLPARRSGTDPRARHSNLLLLPWPLRVLPPVKARVESLGQARATDQRFEQLERNLAAIAARLRDRAPACRVVVVDYLSVLPPDGPAPEPPPPAEITTWGRALAARLAATTEAAASTSGWTYIAASVASSAARTWW